MTTSKSTIKLLGHELQQTHGGRMYWFTVVESARGDLYLRAYRREFGEGIKSRWYGQVSLLSRQWAEPPYKDYPPSRTLLEVDAQGDSLATMEAAMKRRINHAAKISMLTKADADDR